MADALYADLTGAHQRFFDRWLRGRADALDGSAPVRIFVMGLDQWRDEQDWPLPDTSYVDYYLRQLRSREHRQWRRGTARRAPPGRRSDADTYLYDPLRPVPTLGGRVMMPSTANAAGPVDQRRVESREDVLCYYDPGPGPPGRGHRARVADAVRLLRRPRTPTSPASWSTSSRTAAPSS